MSDQSAAELSQEFLCKGFNCAEATLKGLSMALGMNLEDIPQIATGFGGGIARHGEVCGALIGAIMVIGLKFGRKTADEVKAKSITYDKTHNLLRAFQESFGSVRCLDLTGCNMLTQEGLHRAAKEKLHATLCPKFVAFAAEKAYKIITG